jgi:hypothetical protein
MTRILSTLVILCALLLPSVARAQTPAPRMEAVGGSIGIFIPDEAFDNALTLDAFVEHYFSRRVSGRVLFGWTNPEITGPSDDHFRQVKLLFNGVYNWEGGAWHPFVTGGAGFYFVRLKRDDRPDPDGETRGGLNLGGGTEYFIDSQTTIKGELRWDIVSHPPGLFDATGVALTIGIKRYF